MKKLLWSTTLTIQNTLFVLTSLFLFFSVTPVFAEEGPEMEVYPYKTNLVSRWGKEVSPENVWREYPRPQLVRSDWMNLNGLWNYAITPIDQTTPPETWAGQILVPFCLESKLGGVQRLLQPNEALWYQRTFDIQDIPTKRTLLNFEAVDYRCEAWVNGHPVGTHQGGNTPFTFDITHAVRPGPNSLVVRVEDETEAWQLRGKQVLRPHGIWYTRVSGIWQTVWLEHVPETFIEDITIKTDPAKSMIQVFAKTNGTQPYDELRVTVKEGENVVVSEKGKRSGTNVLLNSPKFWSPDNPHLYDLHIELLDNSGKCVEEVLSYTGIRSVGKARDESGHLRFTLNGTMIFHWGTLDQGWWPDGLLTPPSDEAMCYDIQYLKAAGFNMIRKHIKMEPRRYYYHCDRIGMMVWQDQPSGGESPRWVFLSDNPVDAEWPEEHHRQYMKELETMIDTLENHPSIVVWIPFNEAWGQHRSIGIGNFLAQRDPSRLVNIASGGNFFPVGDIVDAHAYPAPRFPFAPERFDNFIKVVGECGGHGFPVQGHLWNPDQKNWGYGKKLPETLEEYKDRYRLTLKQLDELRQQGIAGGVYTQTTDVEIEINGLLTYDREVAKISAEELAAIRAELLSDL